MLRNKKVLMLLSLVIALFLWVYVVAVENPPTERRITNIPINFEHYDDLEERGLAINYDERPRMEIVIAGTRSDVMKVDVDDVLATADLTGYGKGQNYVVVTVKVPRKVDLVEQKTQVIPINVEKLKKINKKVTVFFEGTVAKDFEPKLFSQEITEVQVKGAAGQVAKVASVSANLEIKKLADHEKNYKIKITARDLQGKIVPGVRLSENYLQVTAGMYALKTVNLELDLKREPSAEYQISGMDYPSTLNIRGFIHNIKDVEKIVSEPVYLDELKESGSIPLKLVIPEDIEVLDADDLKLEVKLRGLDSEDFYFEAKDLKIKGISEGKTAIPGEQKIRIRAVGKADDIEKLYKSDIELYVDLSGLDVGEHRVPIKVERADRLPSITVEPEEITINIE